MVREPEIVLGKYCQDDVMVLRQACRVFRREFMHIANRIISQVDNDRVGME